jgi:hypothetical protein
MSDGLLLPYQALLAEPALAGEELSHFAARTPPDHFEEFS